MKRIIINGGKPLVGSVNAGGSKNASLPILFASIITSGVSEIYGMPRIGDTEIALDILSSFGVNSEWHSDKLILDTSRLSYKMPDVSKVCKLRASTYLIGACLSRFGTAELQSFGGCNFSSRPIDLHIRSALAFGADLSDSRLTVHRLRGAEVDLSLPSVGATVNSLLMAASAHGVSHIRGYAREPHVLLLIDYLRSAGADITVSDKEITVSGTPLHGGRVKIIGDMIEAGTYLAAGLVTHGDVEVRGIDAESMRPFTDLLLSMGASISFGEDSIRAKAEGELLYSSATAVPYPGFPTDLQPIIAPLFAVNRGGEIRDTVFPDRFSYLEVLSSFGLKFERYSGGARIFPSSLTPSSVKAPCLRGGAACLLSSLCAKGESVIDSADIILRGYESPKQKLSSLGGEIKIEK